MDGQMAGLALGALFYMGQGSSPPAAEPQVEQQRPAIVQDGCEAVAPGTVVTRNGRTYKCIDPGATSASK